MTCNIEPTVIYFRYNALTTSGRASVWGAGVGVGNPQQYFSLFPDLDESNVNLPQAAACVNSTYFSSYYECLAILRGAWVADNSTTLITANTYAAWNGTPDASSAPQSQVLTTYYADTFYIGGTTAIPQVPFYVQHKPDNTGDLVANLPLSANSSFIGAIVNAKQAPSARWGLWSGPAPLFVNNPVGHVIVGGYDEKRIAGSSVNFTLGSSSASYPFTVNISNIEFTSPTGKTTSILPSNITGVQGELYPHSYFIGLPPVLSTTLSNLAGGYYNRTLGFNTFNASTYNHGNLTITLSNGYQTTISGQELFTYPSYIDNDGLYQINQSVNGLIMNCFMFQEDYVTLGRPYLSSNYLFSDPHTSTFALAPATPWTSAQDGTVTDIGSFCIPGGSSGKGGTSTNVIVGGVVGGVVGLLLISLVACFWICRRKAPLARKQRNALGKPESSTNPVISYILPDALSSGESDPLWMSSHKGFNTVGHRVSELESSPTNPVRFQEMPETGATARKELHGDWPASVRIAEMA